ncbi:MAG: ATP-binding protein [Bacteroidetes bacterium]|nr:ATP-binding protein [Bacteroidota bacterium]
MEKDFNPFLVSGYKDASHFCDREKETALIKKNLQNNINTTLFAIRRIGKTGLIRHVFNSYGNNKKIVCIYVDILSTQNLQEFTNLLATAIYNRFPENKSLGKKIIEAIKLLRPLISFDEFNGNPELSFDLADAKKYEKTIQQLFSFLDSQNVKIVFAIDEFQQILEYPEKNTEALLRTHVQTLKNTQFIFCGSNQKMMNEIFNNAKRPFFASCSNMHLDFIDKKKYYAFIAKMFANYKRKISPESIDYILEFTCCHTFYTQFFCNYLFASGNKNITISNTRSVAADILKLNENTFYQYRNLLTVAQWQLLQAISKEEKLYNAHSKSFIGKYGLGTSSMVSRGIEALKEKEMIFYNSSVEKPYYETYDKFLMRWLQHH